MGGVLPKNRNGQLRHEKTVTPNASKKIQNLTFLFIIFENV